MLTILTLVWVNFSQAANPSQLSYQIYTQPGTKIHTLLIPGNSIFAINTAISPKLDTLSNFAAKYQGISVLNGGYFDPKNHQTTSYIVQNGELVANPEDNERLINNPDLTLYLKKILNRSEFRRYQCGNTRRYDITLHQQPPPAGCVIVAALGGGPQLLPEITAEAEGFVDSEKGRDAIGSNQPNARSALGITKEGDIIWVMAEQKPLGVTLAELAAFFSTLGVEKAINLDGGSSSAFYYQGKTYYGKIDEEGNPVQRPVKSVLLIVDS